MNEIIEYLKIRTGDLSVIKAVLIMLFFIISSVGSNIIFIKHMRRVGATRSSYWNPFYLMSGFNKIEWINLILVFIVALGC